MKKTQKTNEQVTMTQSEMDYVYTCWKQAYSDAYKDFKDYLRVAYDCKRITGSVYN
jgi:hypothetical protein